jgi:MFS family permease
MKQEDLVRDVTKIYMLIGAHAEKTPTLRKLHKTALERRGDWFVGFGIALFVGSLLGDYFRKTLELGSGWAFAFFASLAIGVLLMVIAVIMSVIDTYRTSRRPFADHLSGLVEALPKEAELIAQLVGFNAEALQFARRRLGIQSAKVRSRLEVIGGGGLKASLVGVVALIGLMVMQYSQLDFTNLHLKDATYLVTAALVGGSIAACFVMWGAGRGDFYGDLIDLALELKRLSSSDKKPEADAPWRRVQKSKSSLMITLRRPLCGCLDRVRRLDLG